jgi:hypothetical protein
VSCVILVKNRFGNGETGAIGGESSPLSIRIDVPHLRNLYFMSTAAGVTFEQNGTRVSTWSSACTNAKNMCRRSVRSQYCVTMDSLTLSRHFLAMMKADDLCFSPCRSVATRVSASLSAMPLEHLSFSGKPYQTKRKHEPGCARPTGTSVASWPDRDCLPHPCSFEANHRHSLRPDDDSSFCHDERNLSFPRLQYSDGGSDDDDSRSEVTDTSTRYEDSSSDEANESSTGTECEDDSSFSELSYDGIEFDFGYAAYKAAKPACTARAVAVHVELPDHIWREMEHRTSSQTEQEYGHASELRHRQKASLSQASQLHFRVLPWPREKGNSLQDSRHDLTDTRTNAPSMPRRRESLSAASTLDDDQTGRSRIPQELQRVFLQSQAGLNVEVPPTNITAFQEFRR